MVRLIFNGLAQAAVTVIVALTMQSGFDRLVGRHHSNSAGALTAYGGVLVAGAVVAAGLRKGERVTAERLGQRYIHTVRLALYDQLAASSPRALQRWSRGAVVLHLMGDLSALRLWVSLGLSRLVVSGTLAAVALGALALLSPFLGVTLTAVLVLGGLVTLRRGPAVQEAVREARRLRGRLAANVNDQVAAIAAVQACGQVRRERRRLARQSSELQEAMVAWAGQVGVVRAAVEATVAVASAGALVAGSHEVAAGRTTPGTIVASLIILHRLAPHLRDMGRIQQYWHTSRVAQRRIKAFLGGETGVREVRRAPDLVAGPGRVELDGVSVEGSLRDVSVVAEAGSVVAVVGPNGAGKSTLLSVVGRLVDPDAGTVRLDGQDLSRHSLDSVRRAVGLAAPDLPLLRGSVRRSIRYRSPSATEEEMARVSELLALDEVLGELPEGERTRVVEGGRNLSVGQRQRIALARGLLGQPLLLLLDEADSSLDPRAEAVIDALLAQHRGTALVVTHRLHRVRSADCVWHLDRGRLVEAGPPEELLGRPGPTSRLFGLQLLPH
jgi:ABC-type multidrug transport system fused ATPase/permease subunit